MRNEIRVFAPASVANVACGFDIFGFALEAPGDEVHARLVDAPGVFITSITGDAGRLPKDVERNTAGFAVKKLLEQLEYRQGIEIKVHKKMPLSSGLGSSAASAVGSLFAANQLLGAPLSEKELLSLAIASEKIACGTAHADNAAPALLGGFTLIRSYRPLDVIKIPCQLPLHCSILHPHIEIHTKAARALLPTDLTLKQHIEQSGNAAGLIAGLMLGDADLIGRSLQDVIAEPVRAKQIPGFSRMKQAALEHGAIGAGISGSGPALFAMSLSQAHAKRIGEAMSKACPCACSLYLSKVNRKGPAVIA